MNTFCRVQGRAKPGRSRSRVQAVQQCRETPSSIYCKTCVGTTTGTGPPLVSVTRPGTGAGACAHMNDVGANVTVMGALPGGTCTLGAI